MVAGKAVEEAGKEAGGMIRLDIKTTRQFKDCEEFQEYLDYMVNAGAMTAKVARDLRLHKKADFYHHHLNEHVHTTYEAKEVQP